MTFQRYDIDENVYISEQLTDDDVPSLVKYLNNPVIHTNTLKIPYPYTVNDGETFVNMIQSSPLDLQRIFTIRLKENDELIGECGFYRSNENEDRTEIGYWLGEPFWGRGLMVKVVKRAIQLIQKEWKHLVRIEARIFPWNTGSTRVVEKCGFQFEGIGQNRVHKNGKDVDVNLYALIVS